MNTTLEILDDTYAICRLDVEAQCPPWARGSFVSVTQTPDELSVVCPQVHVPAEITAERDWRCLKVGGPLAFGTVGVIASLTSALAAGEISVFVISTFDTDYLMVKGADLDSALEVLRLAGHEIIERFYPSE